MANDFLISLSSAFFDALDEFSLSAAAALRKNLPYRWVHRGGGDKETDKTKWIRNREDKILFAFIFATHWNEERKRER